ncbi:oxidoreductase [Haloactinomyces albus]|uniref:Aryl-alcohol dehydrogenase-like predicted oxidoreductase n=1 Tax=Haloactinomyces albus TaxID=1352928 RepID=A0AAE3Z8S5_9ACTN|nr:oxidoreductase [Haloactinomyces albus]MDR7300452.1 aryl-alcohol dehydrogenase-like predicted oxidoreductase [Haloactinomyces albus]
MTTTSTILGGARELGTGLTVNRLGFGAMQLAGPGVFGPPTDYDRAMRILRRAVELGINHIDTSDFYGPWVVNELIAEALRPYDEDLVLATKIGAYRDQQGGWLPLNHPDALRAQVHDNLRRLRKDSLDLVYLRFMDGESGTALDDRVGALAELREAGLIRAIGLSHVSVDQFEQARAIAPIAAVQNLYNLVNRSAAELLRRTAETGTAFVPFFPLGSGFTSSRARDDEALRGAAERHGATQAQVSLAWLLQRSPNILLIPGTSSPRHLEENTAAARIELTDAEVAGLDALVADGETLEAVE